MLKEYPTLRNAPITEAVIDIRAKLRPDIDATTIDPMHGSIKEQYPERHEQKISGAQFEIKAGETGEIKPLEVKINGYRYISSDKRQIVQARLDGFTFSRLHPYIKWEDLRNEAHRLWTLYRDITSPESITRVAVRYINNLNIPMPIEDYSDYLTAPPIVPEELPQGVGSFLTRVVIHESSIDAHAIITQALDRIVDPKVAPVILDIDVFKRKTEGIEEKDAWETLEELRKFKNKIFFSSISNKLKEMYE